MLHWMLVVALAACSSESRPGVQGDGARVADDARGEGEGEPPPARAGEGEGEPSPPQPDDRAGEGEGEPPPVAPPPAPAAPGRLAYQVVIEALLWGQTPTHYYLPSTSWAFALAHAQRILEQAGLPLTANAVAAFALKESFMGCDPDAHPNAADPSVRWAYQPAADLDGCFQLECGSAFSELKRMFPERFSPVTHAEVVGGDHFESAALTMAHYMVFAAAMMRMHVPDSAAWMRQHPDKQAGAKALAIVYNRGAWSEGIRVALQDCSDSPELVGCVQGPIGCQPGATDVCDYMRAIGAYTAELSAAASRDGLLYDEPVTADAVGAYVDSIAPLFPEADIVRARGDAVRAWTLYAVAQAAPGFQQVAQPVLDAIVAALPTAADPAQQVSCCFGVSCPPDVPCGAAFQCVPPMACDAAPACDERQ